MWEFVVIPVTVFFVTGSIKLFYKMITTMSEISTTQVSIKQSLDTLNERVTYLERRKSDR